MTAGDEQPGGRAIHLDHRVVGRGGAVHDDVELRAEIGKGEPEPLTDQLPHRHQSGRADDQRVPAARLVELQLPHQLRADVRLPQPDDVADEAAAVLLHHPQPAPHRVELEIRQVRHVAPLRR